MAEFLDKNNIIGNMGNLKNISLELGCGDRKRNESTFGVDMIDYDCVDFVGDAIDVLSAFPESSVDNVYAYHFFEHVADFGLLMRELFRVLKPSGKIAGTVPHFSNPYYFSDYTHKTSFGLYSFSYFCSNTPLSRKTPKYDKRSNFEIIDLRLIFKSPRPFYGRLAFKKILEKIFNISNYIKEFYEENLCYIFPCYEIAFILQINKQM